MLWESTDPEEALSQRFGFADAFSAVGWMGDTLWDTWAITVDDCDRLVISGGNLLAWITTDDRRLTAKWSVVSKLFRRLTDTTTLTVWLHHNGIPVATPIPARDGRLRVELNNVSLGVFPAIEGDLLDVKGSAQVTEAGRMLATLHDAMAAYPTTSTAARQLDMSNSSTTTFGQPTSFMTVRASQQSSTSGQ
jgi:homoserine kinase type II